VSQQITALEKTEHGFAAPVVCPFFLNEGFPKQHDAWLNPAADIVKKKLEA